MALSQNQQLRLQACQEGLKPRGAKLSQRDVQHRQAIVFSLLLVTAKRRLGPDFAPVLITQEVKQLIAQAKAETLLALIDS